MLARFFGTPHAIWEVTGRYMVIEAGLLSGAMVLLLVGQTLLGESWQIGAGILLGVWGVILAAAHTQYHRITRHVGGNAHQICTECGYALTGHPATGTCPECGTSYDKQTLEKAWMRM